MKISYITWMSFGYGSWCGYKRNGVANGEEWWSRCGVRVLGMVDGRRMECWGPGFVKFCGRHGGVVVVGFKSGRT